MPVSLRIVPPEVAHTLQVVPDDPEAVAVSPAGGAPDSSLAAPEPAAVSSPAVEAPPESSAGPHALSPLAEDKPASNGVLSRRAVAAAAAAAAAAEMPDAEEGEETESEEEPSWELTEDLTDFRGDPGDRKAQLLFKQLQTVRIYRVAGIIWGSQFALSPSSLPFSYELIASLCTLRFFFVLLAPVRSNSSSALTILFRTNSCCF